MAPIGVALLCAAAAAYPAQALKAQAQQRWQLARDPDGGGNLTLVAPAVRRAQSHSVERLRAASSELCAGVAEVLGSSKETSMFAQFWDFLCKDSYSCATPLPALSHGCLYVATNDHVRRLLERIGRPHPCSFREVFANSFFSQEACPNEQVQLAKLSPADPSVTNFDGDVEYKTCDDGSLQSFDGGCVRSQLVGNVPSQSVRIYVVDAVMGVPKPWEKAILRERADRQRMPAKQRADDESNRLPASTGGTVTVEFYACADIVADRQAFEERLAKQVDALQLAHDGKLTCDANFTLYDAHETSAFERGLDFTPFSREHFKIIEDDSCPACDMIYHELWRKHMHVEAGKVKVLLCNSASLLGVTEFPWNPIRGIMIDWRTMPTAFPEPYMKQYSQGKTLVHELGHYFGLKHTFEGSCEDADLVSDTDAEETAFFGCPNNLWGVDHYKSCGGDKFDPIHSFLDYADDRCMCGFTHDQYARMRKMLATYG